jgi:hypothetical protein
MQRIVMITLLPTAIKNRNIPQKRLDEQWETHREVLNEVVRRILQRLTCQQHPIDKSGYYNVHCADGNFRHFKPVIAAWLADCPEYSRLHHFVRHVCFCCECHQNILGDYVHPVKQQPRQDHNLYKTLGDANTKPADAELSLHHVHRGLNMF